MKLLITIDAKIHLNLFEAQILFIIPFILISLKLQLNIIWGELDLA